MSKLILIIIILVIVVLLYFRSSANKEAASKNKMAGATFLNTNKQQVGVVETDSGLQYLVLTKGEGNLHPKNTDTVKVHYHGTLLDGSVFDSSVERGQSISFGLHQVIKGWAEGVQLMVVGDKFRFFIPAYLAYGDKSAGKITPASTLIFDVELLAIN